MIDALREYYPDGVDALIDLVNGSAAISRDAEVYDLVAAFYPPFTRHTMCGSPSAT